MPVDRPSDPSAKAKFGGNAAAGKAAATLLNTLCAANTAGNTGGGAYFTSTSRGTLTNCTVVSNIAYGDSGGGIYLDPRCNVTVDSSILCENVPDAVRAGANPGVTYSCIPGASVWPGTGNIAADPQLDPGTFWLLDGSPCIDAGNPDPKMNDGCLPPGKGGPANDVGITGGPNDCSVIP